MGWMNEYEVDEANRRYRDHPVLGPAVRTLANLVAWTNRNSDGWPYWQAPGRAAAKLEDLIERDATGQIRRRTGADDATVEQLKAALRPIKAFRTRHKADFVIIESLDDITTVRTYRFVHTVEADTAEEAFEKLEDLLAREGLGAGEVVAIDREVVKGG